MKINKNKARFNNIQKQTQFKLSYRREPVDNAIDYIRKELRNPFNEHKYNQALTALIRQMKEMKKRLRMALPYPKTTCVKSV